MIRSIIGRYYMKKRITKIEKVNDHYTVNGVPLDYAYWTEESDPPCPECGNKLIFDDEIWSGNEYCPLCNKYLHPKCSCGECSGDNRQNRPITLLEFRKRIPALGDQSTDDIEYLQGWADNAWVANLLNRVEVFERRKYLSPGDDSLIVGQTSTIKEVLQLLGEGKNELPSLLYFKAAMKIIIAELKDSSDRDIYSGFIGQIDTLVQNKNYLEDADYYGVFEYQKFYEKIVKFHYPDEIEEPDDRFDSMYSAQVEEKERKLNLEGQEESVADELLRSSKFKEAIDLYEVLLPEVVKPESVQSLLMNMIQCYKQLKDVAKQKASLERGLELCSQGHESAGIYYEAAAAAYASGDFQLANEYIKKYKKSYEIEIPEDSEERIEYVAKDFGAYLALRLALDKDETVRSACSEWLDHMSDFVPTSLDEVERYDVIDASIQYLRDADLMYRLAESTFVRSATPLLEFGYKGLAELMRGNDEKAYQEFLKYKQVFRKQVENQGEDFEEAWEELKSIPQEIKDFKIPNNDPPLAILTDDYIERYGK